MYGPFLGAQGPLEETASHLPHRAKNLVEETAYIHMRSENVILRLRALSWGIDFKVM